MSNKYNSSKEKLETSVRYCGNCGQRNPSFVTKANDGQKCGHCGGNPGFEYRKEKIK